MKKNLLHLMLSVAVCTLALANGFAQPKPSEPVSPEQIAKLRAAVEADITNMEAHKAYLKAFASADEVKSQYEEWMKKYPRVAAIPKALGDKYSYYSYEAPKYWLRAAELDATDKELWDHLIVNDEMQGGAKVNAYMERAAAANPDDLSLKYRLAGRYKETDPVRWKKENMDLVKRYPTAGETIMALTAMGLESKDVKDRIYYFEQIRALGPKADLTGGMKGADGKPIPYYKIVYEVQMGRLVDAYIKVGEYDKAMEVARELASKQENKSATEKKMILVKDLTEIKARVKNGDYAGARKITDTLTASRGLEETILLIKVPVLDATNSTQEAYNSLLAFQAKAPSAEVQVALTKYGSKLKKDKAQIKQELRSAVAALSKPAPQFALQSYTTKNNISLESLRGKIVFLSFWYPGCGPCRGEMPHIEEALKKIDRSNVVYLGVNGLRDQDDFVLPFMKGTGHSFNPLAGTNEVTTAYKVRAYPTNFIIDKDGNIAYSGFMIHAESG